MATVRVTKYLLFKNFADNAAKRRYTNGSRMRICSFLPVLLIFVPLSEYFGHILAAIRNMDLTDKPHIQKDTIGNTNMR